MSPAQSNPWPEPAACAGKDPEIWFNPMFADEAMSICAKCPAREICQSEADRWDEEAGIWAGIDRDPRRAAA